MAEPRLKGPDFDPERVDAMWAAAAPRILVRERRKRGQRWAIGGGMLVAATAALLIALTWAPREPRPLVAGALKPPAAAIAPLTAPSWVTEERPSSFSLQDGSVVEAEAQTTIQVERQEAEVVSLELARGRARFAVSKRPTRRFSIVAGDVTVRVVGTRFWVARIGEQVRVEVEEGTVEVRYQEQVISLPAPGVWERPIRAAEPLAPPVDGPEDDRRPEGDRRPEHDRAQDRRPAHPVAPKAEPPRAPSKAPIRAAERSRREAADRLFQAAMRARAGGDGQAALEAFAAFLAEHPRDTRAALASFELGRLQMDVAHDAQAAVRSLSRALAASPTASFAEDALARLVRAHDQRGDVRACQEARALYEKRYPAGAYAKSLAAMCP